MHFSSTIYEPLPKIVPILIWYWLSFPKKKPFYNFFTRQGQKPHKKVMWESVAIKFVGRKIKNDFFKVNTKYLTETKISVTNPVKVNFAGVSRNK